MPNAIDIGDTTLLGVSGNNYPLSSGNCMSVMLEGGGRLKIVNFYAENLQELIKNRGLTWPVACEEIGPNVGVISDPRIHDTWFRVTFCETCCPRDLLPLPQRLARKRAIARGDLVEHDDGSEMWRFSDGLIGAPPPRLSGEFIYRAVQEAGATIGNMAALARVNFQ